jgi:hypothetical protein
LIALSVQHTPKRIRWSAALLLSLLLTMLLLRLLLLVLVLLLLLLLLSIIRRQGTRRQLCYQARHSEFKGVTPCTQPFSNAANTPMWELQAGVPLHPQRLP